jgi:tight adherence protein B
MLIIMGGGFFTLIALYLAFAGPSVSAAHSRRLGAIKERHINGGVNVESQMRKAIATRIAPGASVGLGRYIPNPALLARRLEMTGKPWKVKQYFIACAGVMAVVALSIIVKGGPIALAVLGGLALGLLIPHMAVGFFIKKRAKDFNNKFPDSIELMVRGLRSGLPISETLGIVATEIQGPVGIEFRQVCDRIRIGRTMDDALQEAADRIDTAEFKFFCITLAIQRETGGNLAETLANLADVLRKRGQMKLKIKAMSSESKASAYIVGSLPFIVFAMVYSINPDYLGGFFTDQRLIIAGLGGLTWMSIGAFIMAKMVNFEI